MTKDAWQEPLDLEGKDPRVLGSSEHHLLIDCQEPGVKNRWAVIVRRDGNIRAAKVLLVIVPTDAVVHLGDKPIDVIHNSGPENCQLAFIRERRPCPALTAEYPGDTLLELSGGVVEETDLSLTSAGVRECFEELGADPGAIVCEETLLHVPAPASAGAQLEVYSLHCVVYRGNTNFVVSCEEPIVGFELKPLPSSYHWLLKLHEGLEQCTELKTLLALQMLQQLYLDKFCKPLYHAE